MAEEKWLKIPYFGRGKAESLVRALTTGRFKDGLDKALFYFATDTKQWVLVDIDKTIHRITSYEGQPTPPGPGGEGSVKRVDELPPITEGNTETVYLLGDKIYTFNGREYVSIDNEIGTLPEGITVTEFIATAKEEAIESAFQYTDEQLELHIVQEGG